MEIIRGIFNAHYMSRVADRAWSEGFTAGVVTGLLLAGVLALAMLLTSSL